MGAKSGDATGIQDNNLVGIQHTGDALGDDKCRPSPHQGIQGLLNFTATVESSAGSDFLVDAFAVALFQLGF